MSRRPIERHTRGLRRFGFAHDHEKAGSVIASPKALQVDAECAHGCFGFAVEDGEE
jgi:hypothetical protein